MTEPRIHDTHLLVMNTDTPRTDAAKQKIAGYADEWVPRYVCEEIERELTQARTQPDYSRMDSSYGASITRKLLGLSPTTPLFGTDGKIIVAIRDLRVVADQMAEVLEDLSRYPVAPSHPDGPCLERSDMAEVKSVVTKYRALYTTNPTEP